MIILDAILIIIAIGLLLCAGMATYAFVLLKRRPPMPLYSQRSGQPDFLPLDQIPPRLIELILAKEDPHFYTHPGYDIVFIRKAWQTNFREKQIVNGGSTISQQLARNLYLRFNKSYLRKMVELLISLNLERTLGKDRILEMYINIIYFGNGTYGISEAAQFYYHKAVSDLSLNQMVILVVIPAAPTAGNPIQHPEVFERLRNRFLKYAAEGDEPAISPAEADAIRANGAECLDPELRKQDDFTRNYPQTIPLINERFGPFTGNEN